MSCGITAAVLVVEQRTERGDLLGPQRRRVGDHLAHVGVPGRPLGGGGGGFTLQVGGDILGLEAPSRADLHAVQVVPVGFAAHGGWTAVEDHGDLVDIPRMVGQGNGGGGGGSTPWFSAGGGGV